MSRVVRAAKDDVKDAAHGVSKKYHHAKGYAEGRKDGMSHQSDGNALGDLAAWGILVLILVAIAAFCVMLFRRTTRK